MKKVIDGRVYDTDKAQLLGEVQHGDYGNFESWGQALYKSKSGLYFMNCWGGPLSQYGYSCPGGNISGDDFIHPVNIEQAKNWSEKNMTGDEYIEAFGDPEDTEKTAMTFTIDNDIALKLREYQSNTGKSMSSIVSDLIKNNL